jgi:hypothetical protein
LQLALAGLEVCVQALGVVLLAVIPFLIGWLWVGERLEGDVHQLTDGVLWAVLVGAGLVLTLGLVSQGLGAVAGVSYALGVAFSRLDESPWPYLRWGALAGVVYLLGV